MLSRREIALRASEAARAKRLAARTGKVNGSSWRKTKPGKASMISIVPAPAKLVEQVGVPDLSFPSNLRLGMMQTEELLAARNDREARLRQSERLAGPLKRVASAEENQLRIDLLSFELELRRRALADCQRKHGHANS